MGGELVGGQGFALDETEPSDLLRHALLNNLLRGVTLLLDLAEETVRVLLLGSLLSVAGVEVQVELLAFEVLVVMSVHKQVVTGVQLIVPDLTNELVARLDSVHFHQRIAIHLSIGHSLFLLSRLFPGSRFSFLRGRR